MNVTDHAQHFSRREEKHLLNVSAEIARSEYPNLQRAGCPPSKILKALALRQVPLDETRDAVDHICTCSPCFTEYFSYRRRRKLRKAAQLVVCFGIMAGIGILLTGAGRALLPQSRRQLQITKAVPSQEVYRHIVFDLQARSVARGDQPARQFDDDLRIPRALLLLSIYLPIGSEDGIYLVRLQHPSQPASLESRGEAGLRDNIETLEVKMDTTALAPGSYLLRLRYGRSGWSDYPVRVE